jgi:anti-sigma B factor antagonist
MQIEHLQVEDVTKIALEGRLDTAGVSRIEIPFGARAAAGGRAVIVDLSQVSFIASLGVRLFISSARALAAKGGRMVLFAPTAGVAEIIDVMGLGEIIPVVADEPAALAHVRA